MVLDGKESEVANVEVREIRDEQGRLIGEAEYVNGKRHGKLHIWTSQGVLVQESHFRKGEYDGPYQTWWDNGKPKEIGKFLSGKRVGVYRWFTESGELLKEHEYGDPHKHAT